MSVVKTLIVVRVWLLMFGLLLFLIADVCTKDSKVVGRSRQINSRIMD